VTSYQRVADSIRQRLLAGHWQPGQQLPTEREMCAQFGVSQITVRRAMQILEEENLVERRQGSGTFATSATERKIPILNTDYFGSICRHAPRLKRRLHSWQWGQIDAEQAEPLRARPGDRVLKAVRVELLQRQPVTCDQVTIPERFADRLQEADLADLDFVGRWQAAQRFRLSRCEQTIEAVKAQLPVTRLLEVRAGEPLLKETSLMFTPANEPAALFVSYYRHDCFRFSVSFDFGKPRPTRRGP
jgi:GntR family transcriptional regulator